MPAGWRNRSNSSAVPLTKIQIEILRLLASHRDAESYVAWAAPLNRQGPRYSAGIDVFHDREERVAAAALEDARTMEAAGYRISWLRQLPLIYTADVSREDIGTRLEWVVDSDFRFFPTLPDETFGYILHPVDLAANKIMAAAGRREVRDLVDLLTIHQTILPLGAVIWAAVEKSPGFTPEGLVAEIRRNANYPLSEWRAIITSHPLDPQATMTHLRSVLDQAEAFVTRMPTNKAGLLFLDRDGTVVQPDPDRLNDYQFHGGQRRGHWPSSSEIMRAMLDRYKTPPTA